MSEKYRWMQKALDLRVLIQPIQTAMAKQEQLSALKQLWHWARNSGKVDLPDYEVMKKQHIAVSAALSGAMAEAHSQFKARWEGEDKKAGRCAPIMKDLLTMSRFYQGGQRGVVLSVLPLRAQNAPRIRR